MIGFIVYLVGIGAFLKNICLPFSIFQRKTNIHWHITWMYSFVMKSLSCASLSVCESPFDQFWECAQSHTSPDPWPGPASAFLLLHMEFLLPVESCGLAGRGQNSFSRKDWSHLIRSEYCHSILTYVKTSGFKKPISHVFWTFFRCRQAVKY